MLKKTFIALVVTLMSLNLFAQEFTCPHGKVERAGVALVKHYPNAKRGLDYTVLVGVDGSKTHHQADGTTIPLVNFFGGQVDDREDRDAHGHKKTWKAALRELYEETSKAVSLPSKALKPGSPGYEGYVYSEHNKIQLFFLRNDTISSRDITAKQAAAQKNRRLPYAYREASATTTLSLQDILDRAREIQKLEAAGNYAAMKNPKLYNFITCGNAKGQKRQLVHICSYYLRNIARDLARDPDNFPGICARLTGGQVK